MYQFPTELDVWCNYKINLDVAHSLDEAVIRHMVANLTSFKDLQTKAEHMRIDEPYHKPFLPEEAEPLVVTLLEEFKTKGYCSFEFALNCRVGDEYRQADLVWFIRPLTEASFICTIILNFPQPEGPYHHGCSFPISAEEDIVRKKDFAWYIGVLLKITNPYPIEKAWIMNDVGVSNVTPYKPLTVAGYFARGTLFYPYDPAKRDAIWRARIKRTLDQIVDNIQKSGGQLLAPVDTQKLAAKAFPVDFSSRLPWGEVHIILEQITALFDHARGPAPIIVDSLTITPTGDMQTTDLRPYLTLLLQLGKMLGFEDIIGVASQHSAL